MKNSNSGALDALRSYWDRQSQLGDDRQRVDFNPRTQRTRFEAFVRQHQLDGRRVLDLGCGVAAFYEHLRQREIDCDYVGFDLSPEMVDLCRRRYPGVSFVSGDIVEWGDPQCVDFSVAFGIHNVRFDDGWDILERVTRRQFELTRVAAHVSLLTDRFADFGERAQPWPAEKVLSLALDITPYVRLEHDVLPNDFSITLYREPWIDRARNLAIDY